MQKLVKMSGLEGAPAASLTRTGVPTAPSSSGGSCKTWQNHRATGEPPPRSSLRTFMASIKSHSDLVDFLSTLASQTEQSAQQQHFVDDESG